MSLTAAAPYPLDDFYGVANASNVIYEIIGGGGGGGYGVENYTGSGRAGTGGYSYPSSQCLLYESQAQAPSVASMLQPAHTLVLLVQPPTMAPVVLLLVSKGNHSQPQKAAMVQALVVLVATTADSYGTDGGGGHGGCGLYPCCWHSH